MGQICGYVCMLMAQLSMYVCMYVCMCVCVGIVCYICLMYVVYYMCIQYVYIISACSLVPRLLSSRGGDAGTRLICVCIGGHCSKIACTMYNCQRVIIITLLCRPGVPCCYWREEQTRWNWTSPTSLPVRSALQVYNISQGGGSEGERRELHCALYLCIYVAIPGRNRSLFHCVFQSY